MQLIRSNYGEGPPRVWLAVPDGDSNIRHELRRSQVDWILRQLVELGATRSQEQRHAPVQEMRFADGGSLIFEFVDTVDAVGMLRCRYVAFNGQQTAYPTRAEIDSIIQDFAADIPAGS